MQYLLATKNKGKIKYYLDRLKEKGVDIISLNDINVDIDVKEDGNSPLENAIIKAREYNKITNIPSIALDDGLYLDNVENQPGVMVRRVNNKRLNDEEMIEYYTSLVNKYGKDGVLSGYFLKAVAIANNDDIYTFEYKANRTFTNKRSKVINEGYPLASIQIVESLGKFKSELTKEEEELTMDIEQKDIFDFILNTVNEIQQVNSKKMTK